ncbi:hypothetical protein F7725_011014 [Dissostichus mawsoni]|uniref:AMP-dependent synthetase/ligase domain-containing protein n=1 Tax=Dissostichus mawsoni TaxID=36200 RepID=A0A7J5Z8E2_DISMA|nr:hypothetical protein F7725_011014 [Dissostichus mawsoni]
MLVGGRQHNADDIVATALAVEPMKFVYRGRIAVFSITVLHDERIVVVAEQRPDSTEEDSFQWMSRVLQAIDGITRWGCTAWLWFPPTLCLKLLWGHPPIGPASVMVGNLVSGKRIAQASGRDLVQIEDNDQARKGTIASSLTCVQLHKRAEKIAGMLAERGHLQDGDHVALVYPPGIDLIVAFYGCLYAGCVPITVRPPHPQNISTTLPTVKMIVEVSRSVCVMTTQLVSKLLRSKEASAAVEIRSWPPIMDTDDLPKKKPPLLYKPSNPDILAYLDFSVSTTGMLAGVKMSHTATSAFCRSIKLQCELYPSREVAICLDPYCGLGFVLWCLCSVYSGHQSILIPPSELELNPSLWLSAVSQFKVRDTFCSYSPHRLGKFSDQILPGVRIIIANPETKGPMGESHLGEIWVQSGHNSSGYFTVYGDEALQSDHFNSRLSFGDTQTLWLEPDIWASRCSVRGRGSGGSHGAQRDAAVFTWTNLLVVVVELDGSEHEALDLVPLVTNVVLEEHYLIVGVVVVVDISVIPINSRGEKQRMHLRDGFLADQLDPIYVAYNM